MTAVYRIERRRSTRIIAAAFAVVILVLTAAEAAEAPVLADVDRLRIQALALRMENAELKAQAAQRDYDQARDQLRTVLQQLQKPGFLLDLETLAYRPAPVEAPSK